MELSLEGLPLEFQDPRYYSSEPTDKVAALTEILAAVVVWEKQLVELLRTVTAQLAEATAEATRRAHPHLEDRVAELKICHQQVLDGVDPDDLLEEPLEILVGKTGLTRTRSLIVQIKAALKEARSLAAENPHELVKCRLVVGKHSVSDGEDGIRHLHVGEDVMLTRNQLRNWRDKFRMLDTATGKPIPNPDDEVAEDEDADPKPKRKANKGATFGEKLETRARRSR